jgi:hypothetical protein
MSRRLHNILHGTSTVLDISSSSSHFDKVVKRPPDRELIAGDWRRVGDDIHTAIRDFELNVSKPEKK